MVQDLQYVSMPTIAADIGALHMSLFARRIHLPVILAALALAMPRTPSAR
jgi:hypothetical protein